MPASRIIAIHLSCSDFTNGISWSGAIRENVTPASLKPLPQIGKRALYFRAKALDDRLGGSRLKKQSEPEAVGQRRPSRPEIIACRVLRAAVQHDKERTLLRQSLWPVAP